ncbi:MAG: glutathione synthase [Myxococcales bacterium]|nr:glutathione synthase [Myxococcales bacterium]
MRLLFVMDPAESMSHDKDTTFAFMRGAQALGHACLHCLPRQIGHVGRELFADARPISVSEQAPHVSLGAPETVQLAQLDAVFIRKDPPFDVDYLHLTQQLDLVRDRTLIVNDPRGLQAANEKLFAFHFAHLMPESLVTSDRQRILDFVRSVGGRGVIKPLDGAGGVGVLSLFSDDQNARAIVDVMTHEGKQLALVQEYQPAVREGDKRVLLLDGKPLGAILRVPRADDIRANIHVGGTVRPTELSAEEQALVEEMGPQLASIGLYFVGLDLIGGRLIEVNVTSPTGIQELARHLGEPIEQDVIRWVEANRR